MRFVAYAARTTPVDALSGRDVSRPFPSCSWQRDPVVWARLRILRFQARGIGGWIAVARCWRVPLDLYPLPYRRPTGGVGHVGNHDFHPGGSSRNRGHTRWPGAEREKEKEGHSGRTTSHFTLFGSCSAGSSRVSCLVGSMPFAFKPLITLLCPCHRSVSGAGHVKFRAAILSRKPRQGLQGLPVSPILNWPW